MKKTGLLDLLGWKSCIALVALLVIAAGNGCIVDPAKKNNRQGNTNEPAAKHLPEKTPLVKRTLVFSRSQVKYNLYQNCLHRWLDRPLFYDRSLAPTGRTAVVTYPSFSKIADSALAYDIDGFAILIGNPRMLERYQLAVQCADRANKEIFQPRGQFFRTVPEFNFRKDIPTQSAVLETALASPSTLRLGKKVLVSSYAMDQATPNQIREMLAELRAKHGDTFLFLPALSPPKELMQSWQDALDKGKKDIPEAVREKTKSYYRSYLNVCDGLYYAGKGFRTLDRKIDTDFYRNVLIPIMREVVDEPAYAGKKYLGLSAVVGYFYFTGSTLSEDGTKTLRRGFEAAMAARPDIIIMPEWDELNENNCIGPTVCNSFSTQRILKYYMHQLKGETLTPNPGDDPALPNLVVSYRRILTLGEPLEIELLNIPDSEKEGDYRVAVTLLDEAGRTVNAFPPQALPRHRLEDRTLILPTETITNARALVPTIEIEDGSGNRRTIGEGFCPILLRTSWTWDYKWVKQPLRDLIFPKEASMAVKDQPGSATRDVSVAVECKEPLSAVEIIENGDEIYAYDREEEYPRGEGMVLISLEARAVRPIEPFKGIITIRGTQCVWPKVYPAALPRGYTLKDNNIRVLTKADNWFSKLFVGIPLKDIETAVVEVDLNVLKTTIPVKRVVGQGIYVETRADGFSFAVSVYNRQPDHPLPIDRDRVNFRTAFVPELPDSLVYLRLVTRSGKTFRSRPWMPPAPANGETVKLPVFSESKHAVVPVCVPAHRITDIRYEFTPRYGSMLYTPAGRPFYASLGSYENSLTQRMGGQGGIGGYPFTGGLKRNYPANAKDTAPVWVEDDGKTCLKFDGIGNFIIFPHEVLPRRSAFTLTFEIKPLSDKSQVLFAHHGHYIGSLVLRLENNRLYWSYHPQYADPDSPSRSLDSGLTVPCNKWSTVTVRFDLETIMFAVNGKESKPMKCPGPGMYIGPSVFGGFGKTDGTEVDFVGASTSFFEGYLRAFRVIHAPVINKN